jgi:hypothetical protein
MKYSGHTFSPHSFLSDNPRAADIMTPTRTTTLGWTEDISARERTRAGEKLTAPAGGRDGDGDDRYRGNLSGRNLHQRPKTRGRTTIAARVTRYENVVRGGMFLFFYFFFARYRYARGHHRPLTAAGAAALPH